MTENIFENGGEFCMRCSATRKPVEWMWYKTRKSPFCVVYLDGDTLRGVTVGGKFTTDGTDSVYDLIPIPSPPQIVPWESPDDVPDGIWIRDIGSTCVWRVVELRADGVRVGATFATYGYLHKNCEYHTDRRAKEGWQPCGKVVKS